MLADRQTDTTKLTVAFRNFAYGGRKRTSPFILRRGNRWVPVVNLKPRPLYPEEELRYPFIMRVGRSENRSGRFWEEKTLLTVSGIGSPSWTHLAVRHTGKKMPSNWRRRPLRKLFWPTHMTLYPEDGRRKFLPKSTTSVSEYINLNINVRYNLKCHIVDTSAITALLRNVHY